MQLEIDPTTQTLLDTYGFDRALFLRLRAALLAGDLNAEANRLRAEVTPPAPGQVRRLPEPGSAEHTALTDVGLRALRAGEVGCVVLAGGMATRFGGVVKAAVEA